MHSKPYTHFNGVKTVRNILEVNLYNYLECKIVTEVVDTGGSGEECDLFYFLFSLNRECLCT